MFTGIVEEIGKVVRLDKAGRSGKLEISSSNIAKTAKAGDSIAVNGVCLTVRSFGKDAFSFDVMNETLSKTNLGFLKKGSFVNLEMALTGESRMSGHYVYGHVDGARPLLEIKKKSSDSHIDIGLEPDDAKYIIEKGSIAVDGISLTVGKILNSAIRLFIIPHTWENTIIEDYRRGDRVNIEFDVIGKYIYRQLHSAGKIDMDFLRKTGFSS